jgi:phosphate transport system substrate-binding protein
MANELDYVPLPAALVAQVEKTWSTEITAGGHPVWSGK